MALPADYVSGTITLTAGSTAFTGTGTGWLAADFREGDIILDVLGGGNRVAVVAAVTGNGAGTLTKPWEGPTLANVAYRLRYQWDSGRVSAQTRTLIEQLGNGNLQSLAAVTGAAGNVVVFNGPGAIGIEPRTNFINGVTYDVQVNTLADRAAYNGQSAGFTVLVSNVGDGRSAVYSKRSNTSADWTNAAYITGPSITLDVTEVDEVPYGTSPNITLTPRTGGYGLAFDIPRGMIIEPGTTTTLAPDQQAAVTFVPITGGYRLDIALPRGPTGDIDGVTPFWVSRLGSDADAAAARVGLGAGLRPILVFASGQSNMSRYETYSWAPPANLKLWNHDPMTDVATHVGTAFNPIPSSRISLSWVFAAEIARANPLRMVYVVNTAQAGQPISKWLPGGGAPDLYATGKNNVQAALAVINEPVDLVALWWQGENDTSNANYQDDFLAYRGRLAAESWWDRDTPMAVFGVSPFRSGTPGLLAKRFNKIISLTAAQDPEKIKYVATDAFGIGSGAWDVSGGYLHVSALGHLYVGRLAHRVMFGGMGRANLRGAVVDPDTLQLVQPTLCSFLASVNAALTGPVNVTGYTLLQDNSAGAFSAASGVFTAPVAGLYDFRYTLGVYQNQTLTSMRPKLNGAVIPSYGGNIIVPPMSDTVALHGSLVLKLNVGDQVNLDIGAGTSSGTQRFSGYFVG